MSQFFDDLQNVCKHLRTVKILFQDEKNPVLWEKKRTALVNALKLLAELSSDCVLDLCEFEEETKEAFWKLVADDEKAGKKGGVEREAQKKTSL
ncbi:Hypothetical predicted protein [Lecanosticta acicola]|uniref:Uncharacterized protein n=1 Tax=Lecanosticta acicola TaxID=111012 RepID=A0AAI8YRI9_9PEZI|nr:Hypothetical predicted protein [Lecanosticta acicola]